MPTDCRQIGRGWGVAALVSAVLLASTPVDAQDSPAPAPAASSAPESQAAEVPADTLFAHGGFWFRYPDGIVVRQQTVQAPEGPVDIVFLEPLDPATGRPSASTFVALTWYPVPVRFADGEATTAQLQESVVQQLAAGWGPQTRVEAQDTTFEFAGNTVAGQRLTVRRGSTETQATLGAVRSGRSTLVFVYHRAARDAAHFEALNQTIASLQLGRP